MPAFREKYGYDALGRLVSVDGPAGSVRYTWDARGHRVASDPKCPSCGAIALANAVTCAACGARVRP